MSGHRHYRLVCVCGEVLAQCRCIAVDEAAVNRKVSDTPCPHGYTPAAPVARRPCPYPECMRTIERDVFACRDHWYTLPVAVRARINRAWAAYRKDPLAAVDEMVAAQAEAQASAAGR